MYGQENEDNTTFLRIESGKMRENQEILLKLEESQEKSGIFIIHANEFFGAQ